MTNQDVYISFELIEAIKSFPNQREIIHCDSTFFVSPFDFYAICPKCQTEIKIRSMSAVAELEDVFDAVFEWLTEPKAKEYFEKRQSEIIRDNS